MEIGVVSITKSSAARSASHEPELKAVYNRLIEEE